MVAMVVGISLLAPVASMAASAPEVRPDLTVHLLSANGSGCPSGSTRPVAADVQPTGAVTVRYLNFVVSGGDYRTCVVVVNVATTAGWTYMIPSVENRAWAKLDAGGTATLATSMWFTGFDWTVKDNKQVAGPLNNYWATSAAPEQPTWAPCGESVNLAIAETVRVAETSSNTASLVTTSLNPPTWRRC
jgi:hypothetical protein